MKWRVTLVERDSRNTPVSADLEYVSALGRWALDHHAHVTEEVVHAIDRAHGSKGFTIKIVDAIMDSTEMQNMDNFAICGRSYYVGSHIDCVDVQVVATPQKMPTVDRFVAKCTELVAYLTNEYNELHKKEQRVNASNVFVVWSCKTLQNMKAIVATNNEDQLLFECTYSGDKGELYVDVYDKLSNHAYPFKA